MNPKFFVAIYVKRQTKEHLYKYKGCGESWDDVLKELISYYEENEEIAKENRLDSK